MTLRVRVALLALAVLTALAGPAMGEAARLTVVRLKDAAGLEQYDQFTGQQLGEKNNALSWEPSSLGTAEEGETVLLEIDGVPMLVQIGAEGVAALDVSKEKWKHEHKAWGMGEGALQESVAGGPYSAAYLLLRVGDEDPAGVQAMGFGFRSNNLADVRNIYVGATARTSDEGVTVSPVADLGRQWYLARVPLNPSAMRHGSFHMGRPFQNLLNLHTGTVPQHAGRPSALRVAAITFARAGIDLAVTGNGLGNVYCEPDQPALTATVTNLTDEPVQVVVSTELIPHGRQSTASQEIAELAPLEAREFSALAAPITERGHYRVRVVADAGRRGRSEWRTNVALLAPDTRKKENSPFGCWPGLSGDRATTEQRQYLFEKAGVGYIHGKHTYTHRLFGTRGHPTVSDEAVAEGIARRLSPTVRTVMFGWEKSWSIEHNNSVPAVITAGWPEALTGEVNEKIDGVVEELRLLSAAIRRIRPDVKISLGNTGVNWVTPLLQRGIKPGEHFDYFGTEEHLFLESPERPCDAMGNIDWWAKAILEHFGYYDVPLFHSESMYYNTGPGFTRISERDQAGWYARAFLIGLAYGSVYGISGAMVDSSEVYIYALWGKAGYCNQAPECSPKLSYVTYATLTQLLDGASYDGKFDTGTTSVYALKFKQPDGAPIYVLWNLRGEREVRLVTTGGGRATVVDGLNRPVKPRTSGRGLVVTISDLPTYVRGVQVERVEPGRNVPQELPPQWKQIARLPEVSDWTIDRQPNADFGAPRVWSGGPRVVGRFQVSAEPSMIVPGSRTRDAVKIAQGRHHVSGLVPRYATLRYAPEKAIPIPCGTTRLGVWVYGNSTWAEIKFCLQDESGAEHIVLSEDPSAVMCDNFDGWRFLASPYLAKPEWSRWMVSEEKPEAFFARLDKGYFGGDIAEGNYKLTGFIVTMPEQQVYVDELVSTPEPWIALSGLYGSDEKDLPVNYLPW